MIQYYAATGIRTAEPYYERCDRLSDTRLLSTVYGVYLLPLGYSKEDRDTTSAMRSE